MAFAGMTRLASPSIDWSARDAASQYTEFKRTCELYFSGPLADLTEERKVKYLLIWSGKEGRELADTWNLQGEDAISLDKHWEKFLAHVKPRSNFRLARHQLRGCTQAPTERVDAFVHRLRTIAAACEYTNVTEQLIDALIFGTKSKEVQKTLLKKSKTLTLDAAIEIARTEEATCQQLEGLQSPNSDMSVHVM